MPNANYNYSLNIGATIKSTDNLKTQLDAFANKYKMKIEVKLSDMKLDQLNRNLGNATTAMNDLRKATSAAGQDMKGINANASQLNRTLTTTATDVRSVSTGIENLTRVTESSSSVINTNLDRVGDNVVDVERAVRTIDERFENLGRNGLNNLNRLNQGTQNLERSTITFGNVLHRVFEFYVASLPIRVFETAVRETIEVIQEFDSSLTEFKKVSDLSGESLNKYTEELGELGLTVARTRSEMTEMAGNFKKAGFSEEEAKQLSVVASMYQNVADSEISAGDAANYVTSQIKAFHLQAEDAQNIIDQLNIVSNNFAVSSTDISTALTKTASAMATLGNDMSQTIGLVTAGTEQLTGQASKVAKGLRTIGLNISKVAQESGELEISVNGVTKSISLLNEQGDALGSFDVLEKIAKDWQNMTLMEQQTIGAALAGKTQYEVFAAVMSNFKDAIDASEKALEAEGSALRENEAVLDSLQGRLQKLKSAFSNLVLGEGGLTNFAKLILEIGTKLLEFANTDIGQTIIQIGLLTAAIVALSSALQSQFVVGLLATISNLGNLVTAIGVTITQTYAASGAFAALTAGSAELAAGLAALGINPVVLGITVLVSVVYLAYKAYKKWINGIEDTKRALDETENSIEEEKNKIQDLVNKIDEINEKELHLTNQEDIDNLEKEKSSLETQLAIEKAINDELENRRKKELESLANKKGKSVGFAEQGWGELGFGKGSTQENLVGTSDQMLQRQIGDLETLNQRLQENWQRRQDLISQAQTLGLSETQLNYSENELRDNVDNLNTSQEQLIRSYQATNEEYNQLVSWFREVNGSAAENVDVLQQLIDNGLDTNGVLQTLIDSWNGLQNAIKDESNTAEETSDSSENQAEAIQALANELGIETQAIWDNILANEAYTDGEINFTQALAQAREELQAEAQNAQTASEKYQELIENLDDIASAYETLKGAVDEYNSSGQFSIETATALLKLDPEYLALLQFENEQLTLNKTGYDNLVDAKIADARATNAAAIQEKVNAIILQDSGEKAANAGDDYSNSASTVATATTSFYNSSLVAIKAGANFDKLWQGMTNWRTGSLGLSDEARKAIDDVYHEGKNADNALLALQDSLKNVGSAATSTGRSGSSAAKSATDATKELEETLKNLREYIIDKVEKAITKLENKIKNQENYIKELETVLDNVGKKYDELISKAESWIETLKSNFDIVENFVSTGNKELDELLKQLNKLDKEYKEKTESLDKAIKSREKLIDSYDDEIDKLKDAQNDIKDYYDEQIDALKKTNTELERQIKLEELLDALSEAKSKKVKTYTSEGGFQYGTDTEAVSKAEKALQEYQTELKQTLEIEGLEELRDTQVASLQTEIDSYEELKKIAEQDKDDLETQKENLTIQYNNNKELLNEQAQHLYEKIDSDREALVAHQKAESDAIQQQIDAENTKLENANKKLKTTNKRLKEFKKSTETKFDELNSTYISIGNSIAKDIKDASTNIASAIEALKSVNSGGDDSGSSSSGSSSSSSSKTSTKSSTTSKKTSTSSKKKASGDRYIDTTDMYLIGDNPNQNELVIGAKLNGATSVGLERGSGVIPHTLTSTLMNMAEEYGRSRQVGVLGTTNNSRSTTISIGNVSLPNVSDGNSFVDYLQNFSLDMTQEAYSRR